MNSVRHVTGYRLLTLLGVGAMLWAACGHSRAYGQDKRREVTLDQIRAGLQSNWSYIQTRRVRFVQTAAHVPVEQASPLYPDRTEFEVIYTADGKYWRHEQTFRGGVKREETETSAHDGRHFVSVRRRNKLRTEAVYLPSPDIMTYELPIMMLQYVLPFHEIIARHNGRLIGEIPVDGSACVRVEVTLPDGYNGGPGAVVYFDVDPDKGFWPRRILARKFAAPKDTFIQPPSAQVLEFEKQDGIWYPRVARNLMGGSGEFIYVLHAELNREYPVSTFQPELPSGAIVDDRIRGVRYVAGGEQGRQARQQQLVDAARAPPPTTEGGTETSTVSVGVSASWLFAGVGALLILAAALIHYRTR